MALPAHFPTQPTLEEEEGDTPLLRTTTLPCGSPEESHLLCRAPRLGSSKTQPGGTLVLDASSGEIRRLGSHRAFHNWSLRLRRRSSA